MNIHLIAIGGSVMHSMAIALKNKGKWESNCVSKSKSIWSQFQADTARSILPIELSGL